MTRKYKTEIYERTVENGKECNQCGCECTNDYSTLRYCFREKDERGYSDDWTGEAHLCSSCTKKIIDGLLEPMLSVD